ncbi:hypothetical protein [Blastococcus sp. URHD0036]|uniref:hypothetical protein n=1 Tax=Blastococcus sp. URHD0036 TaxID=1380356 RepID=UPI000497E040|nr:hypothetical protein [Blastococcus sp. URHD0036]
MTGPSPSWSPPPVQYPQPGGQVAWAGGVAAPPVPGPPRSPVDVGGVLRLVSGGLLVAAGVLTAIACALTMYAIDGFSDGSPFEATAWSDSGDRYPTPVRWGIPMAVVATVLVVGGVLLLASRWAVRLRGAAAATGTAAVGGVLAVGWMVGSYVGGLADLLRETGADVGGGSEALDTGGGTVLLQIALWTALAAVVPLVLAPVADAVRARTTAGGAR